MATIDLNETGSMGVRLGRIGADLSRSFGALLDALPGMPMGQRQLAGVLGVSTVIAHRLVKAVERKDPLATAHLIPGPQPLRKVIKAARKHGVSTGLARDAERAVQAFESIIREEGGDRSGLDAITSAVIPEVRTRYETLAKQSIYRGMRQVKGICTDLTFNTVILHPSDSDHWWDQIWLTGMLGVRRVRPAARLVISRMSKVMSVPTPHQPHTLDGQPVEDVAGVVLHSFCSGTPVELTVQRCDDQATYYLDWGNAVGETSARDVVLGERRRHAMRRCRSADDLRTKSGFVDDISVPSRQHVFDILLHKDAYPDWTPALRVLECGGHGYAEVNDASRDADLLDVDENIELLGTGIEHARAVDIPRYHELLTYTFRKTGCDPKQYRVYRTQIDYPIVGSQLQFPFDVPVMSAE